MYDAVYLVLNSLDSVYRKNEGGEIVFENYKGPLDPLLSTVVSTMVSTILHDLSTAVTTVVSTTFTQLVFCGTNHG